MQTPNDRVRGENGTMELTAMGVGDARVALFFALVRGAEDSKVQELMNNCLEVADEKQLAEVVADLFVMALQTRDCRGGKGERLLFYKMLLQLFDRFPSTVLQMMSLFGEYGYFKDFFKLAELAEDDGKYDVLRQRITDIVANTLIADESLLDNGTIKGISLCAKYAPREGKHFAKGDNSTLFKELVNKIYPAPVDTAHKQNRKQYRQLIAKLTKALDVPEVKMCGKRYSDLDFNKVPSVCTKKFTKAFLNEKLKEAPNAAQEQTGNRFPDHEDRILCRQNLRKAALDGRVKGKQVYPHDIVKTLYEGGHNVSILEKEVLNAQWNEVRGGLLAQLEEKAAAAAAGEGSASAVNVGKLVPLSDVSSSMDGIPMLVSIALGILVSEVNHPAFRDRVLTFDTNPSWVNLGDKTNIAQKVDVLRKAPWGGSTDITKAFRLICNVVQEHRLPAEEVPDMIIFSDMQFDETADRNSGTTATQLENVREMFAEVGRSICGQPYPAPKIIFWNLRAGTVGYPAASDDENVQMLSGFSPSLLKYVLEGEAPGEEEEMEEEVVDAVTGETKTVKVKVTKAKPTPYETLRKVLDDERYHPARQLLSQSVEGPLALYHFEAPADETATMDVVPPTPPPVEA
mmetsp:Transcript_30232/g.50573  ORF Transcript_30232/g.50573 Transcript_30232/m.50573 type:complete len:629 (+) Transcript_30232:70-1956(+)